MPKQKDEETSAVSVIGNYAVMAAGSDIAAAIAANLGAGAVSAFELDRAKVPAGGGTTWEIPSLDGTIEAKEIDGVIVGWRAMRSYWAESFDSSGGGTPPDCASEDGVIGVGAPGGECAACPLASYGSATKGGGQACKQTRLLFVLRENDHLPIMVSVPPSSLKEVSRFFLRLAGQGLKFSDCVSRFTLRKTSNKTGIAYSEINLTLVSRLDGGEREKIAVYAAGLAPLMRASAQDSTSF
jgi:hypothetical protein